MFGARPVEGIAGAQLSDRRREGVASKSARQEEEEEPLRSGASEVGEDYGSPAIYSHIGLSHQGHLLLYSSTQEHKTQKPVLGMEV